MLKKTIFPFVAAFFLLLFQARELSAASPSNEFYTGTMSEQNFKFSKKRSSPALIHVVYKDGYTDVILHFVDSRKTWFGFGARLEKTISNWIFIMGNPDGSINRTVAKTDIEKNNVLNGFSAESSMPFGAIKTNYNKSSNKVDLVFTHVDLKKAPIKTVTLKGDKIDEQKFEKALKDLKQKYPAR